MRRSPRAILFLTVFLDLLGFGIVIPFMAYTVQSFGASESVVGLLVASYSLAQFVCAPLWGRLSDRIGRRPVLLVGLSGSAVGYFLFGTAGSLMGLFAGRILAGVAGATISTAQAYVADVTRPEDRAKGMGMIGAAFGLGFMLGPALGGVLASQGTHLADWLAGTPAAPLAGLLRHHPYSLPCLVASLLSATDLVAALFLLPESLSPELREQAAARRGPGRLRALSEVLEVPALRQLVTTFFLYLLGFSMMESTLPLLLRSKLLGTEMSAPAFSLAVGMLFGLIGLVSAVVQGGLVGRLTRRFGELSLLQTGLGVGACAMGLLPLLWSWPLFRGGGALVALASGLVSPSLASLVSRAAGPERQGQTMGVQQSSGALARVLGPVLGGTLFQHLGRASPYLTAALLLGGAAGVLLQREPEAR